MREHTPPQHSRRADDEFGEGILGNQKFKKMYYLNVSESGIGSRKGRLRLFYYCAAYETCKNFIPKKHTLGNLKLY
jgi:hypothetical protein